MNKHDAPDLVVFDIRHPSTPFAGSLCADEIVCIIHEAADLGARRIELETSQATPLARLVRYATTAAIRLEPVTVAFASGEPFSADDAEELRDAGVSDVSLPLSCFVDEGERRRNIERLRELGLGVRVRVVAQPSLCESISDMAAAVAHVGATTMQIDVVWSSGECALAGVMLEKLARSVLELLRAGTIRVVVSELPVVRRLDAEAAGTDPLSHALRWVRLELEDSRSTMVVLRSGDVIPSKAMPLVAGDVRRQQLAGIWSVAPLYPRLRDSGRLTGRCGRCDFRTICGGSRVRAWRATGDYNAADPACILDPHSSVSLAELEIA